MAALDGAITELNALKASNTALVSEVAALKARVAALQVVDPTQVDAVVTGLRGEVVKVNAAVAELKTIAAAAAPPVP